MLDLYPRSTIDVSLLILNQDGSLLSTAINAVTLALIHAGIALSSPVSAITLSVLHDTALLDPCSPEENELPSLTVACMAPLGGQDIGKLTLVSLDSRLTMDRFEALLRLATKACAVIGKEIEDVSKDFAQSALHALGGASAREGRAIVMHADDDEDAMVDG